MKRQKLKVFICCFCHNSSNKRSANNLFTILFNRSAVIGVVLLLSLLPLNAAAPTTKSSKHSGEMQTLTPIATAKVAETNTDSVNTLKTIESDKYDDKLVPAPKFTPVYTIENRPEALSTLITTISSSSATPWPVINNDDDDDDNDDETHSNLDNIENNHDIGTIKSNSATTVGASSSNNYHHHPDKKQNSVATTMISVTIESQPFPMVIDVFNNKSTINDTTASIDSLSRATKSNVNDGMFASTASVPISNYSTKSLSHVLMENGPQEIIAATPYSGQTKVSPVLTDPSALISTSLSDNVASSTPASLTEIDEPSSNRPNQTKLKLRLNGNEDADVVPYFSSNGNNPVSITTTTTKISSSSSTNDNDGTSIDAITERTVQLNARQTDMFDEELGQMISTSMTTLDSIKASSNINSSTVKSNHVGKITKSVDEEKSSNRKVKQENIGNNNKKHNNKNNKDKSKKKSNEDGGDGGGGDGGGVNDPNKKPNDDTLMRESTSLPLLGTTTKLFEIKESNAQTPSTSTTKLENVNVSDVHTPDGNRDYNLDDASLTTVKTTLQTLGVSLPSLLAATHSTSMLPKVNDTTTTINNTNSITSATIVISDVSSISTSSLLPTLDTFVSTVATNQGNVNEKASINGMAENAHNWLGNVIENISETGDKNKLNADEIVAKAESTLRVMSVTESNSIRTAKTATTLTNPLSTATEANTKSELATAVSSPNGKQLKNDDDDDEVLVGVGVNQVTLKHLNVGKDVSRADNEFNYTMNIMNVDEVKTTAVTPTPPTMATQKTTTVSENHNILDYDKSSEEIFDIVRESSTTKAETEMPPKKKPYELDSDEFFIPADDLDAITLHTTSTATTPSTKTNSVIVIDTLPTTALATIETTIQTEAKLQTTIQNKESTIERDSDTIFYISNTEVKVVESSVPTPNTKQENQFFPAIYEEDVIIDFHGKNNSSWNSGVGNADKYEEDIILSPMKTNFDPTKLSDENLSISYVGESFIDIKESINDESGRTAIESNNKDLSDEISSNENARSLSNSDRDNAISSNVIIEPVAISDVSQSIGVPIIAELPSQIDIHDLDYKSDAIQLNNSENSITSHSLTHSGDNLQKTQQLSAELPKTDPEETVAVGDNGGKLVGANDKRNNTNRGNATAEAITNVTAFSVPDDDPETNLNDIQTLAIASLSTVLPLLGCFVLLFAIRQVYKKVHRLRSCNTNGMNGKGLLGDSSTDPLAINSRTMSADELKSTDCEGGINHSNDNLISCTEISSAKKCDEMTNAATGNINHVHHSGANGSLITMTMKNNHLIVETEERSDIARDVRETKVHYSPSEKDGVFVVEVARGADSNAGTIKPHIPKAMASEQPTASVQLSQPQNSVLDQMHDDQTKSIDYASSNDGTASWSKGNEEVLVHPPPNGICADDDVLMVDEDGAVSMSSPMINGNKLTTNGKCGSTNTGLSQSDLSISSSTGSNKGYRYGTQDSYTIETKCYQSTPPHYSILQTERLITPEPITVIDRNNVPNGEEDETKPIIMDAILKSESLSIEIVQEKEVKIESDLIEVKCKKLAELAAIEVANANELQDKQIQENGIVLVSEPETNGKHILDENECNDNENSIEESNDFDSLMYLPAPPTCEEIKQFNEITVLENGNLDSLPPPPPEVASVAPINVES